MKKYFYVFLYILLISLFLLPQEKVSAEGNLNHYVTIDGVYYYIIEASEISEHDAYAIIEDYNNAENVINGVYTLPFEVVHNGNVYPIVGVNGFFSPSDRIKEVIVPKEFGSKEVKTHYYHFENKIGDRHFFSLPNVEKVTIHAENINITNIFSDGGYLIDDGRNFYNKSVLRELNIDSGKVTIGKYALDNLSNLESINFSKDAEVTLKKYGIINCEKLSSLILPAKTKFTEGAVIQCKNLNSIEFMEGARYTVNQGIISPVGTLLFVPANVKTYQVPSNVKKIGELAFSNCSRIETVTSGGEIIGEFAFYGCKTLTSVKLKETTEKIESYAFALCDLKSITIPKSVKSIGHGILYKNENLSSIKASGKYYKAQNGALTTISGKTLLAIIPKDGVVNIPSKVVTVKGLPITAPSKVKSMKFPSFLRVIYQMGEKMPQLTKITFTSSVIPEARELEWKLRDLGLGNIGYDQAIIWASAGGKLVIDVPNGKKQSYKKFIKKNIECGMTYTIK